MNYRRASMKLTWALGVLLIGSLAASSGEALAMGTQYFCSAAVAVFAVASTLGLVTRLRA